MGHPLASGILPAGCESKRKSWWESPAYPGERPRSGKGDIMTPVKIIVIVCVVYVGIVVAFESLLGHFQPAGRGTMSITTTQEGGGKHTRVVARLETDGPL